MKRLLEILLGILLQVIQPKLAEEGGKNKCIFNYTVVQESFLQGSLTFANSMAVKYLVYCVCLPQLPASRVWCLGSESPTGTLGRDSKVSVTRKWKESPSVFEGDLLVFTILLCFIHAPYLSGLSLSVLPLSFSSPTPGPPVALYTLAHLSKGLL